MAKSTFPMVARSGRTTALVPKEQWNYEANTLLFIIPKPLLTCFRNGHGCMLQYALLHLFGYGVSMDDLKHFRVRLRRAPLKLIKVNLE